MFALEPVVAILEMSAGRARAAEIAPVGRCWSFKLVKPRFFTRFSGIPGGGAIVQQFEGGTRVLTVPDAVG